MIIPVWLIILVVIIGAIPVMKYLFLPLNQWEEYQSMPTWMLFIGSYLVSLTITIISLMMIGVIGYVLYEVIKELIDVDWLNFLNHEAFYIH